MTIKHLLIDLDDTLLTNSMDTFGPAYFKGLSKHLSSYIDPSIMIPALIAGTKAMTENLDPSVTLELAFDKIFYPQIGIPKSEIHAQIESFYRDHFPALRSLTSPISGGVELVQQAIKAGYSVSIATNPLFPRTAITQRIAWAGFDLSNNPFLLIPSYEDFHFAKPNPEFYLEFINRISAQPSECVMIGNDYEMDIIPSEKAGLRAFHFAEQQSEGAIHQAFGNLNQVLEWVQSIG